MIGNRITESFTARKGEQLTCRERRRKILKRIGCLAALGVLGAGGVEIATYAADSYNPYPELSQAVGKNVSKLLETPSPTTVVCNDTEDLALHFPIGDTTHYLGRTFLYALSVPSNQIHLSERFCDTIAEIPDTKSPPLDSDSIEALILTGHETVHQKTGTLDEPTAECYAIQITAGALAHQGYSTETVGVGEYFRGRYTNSPKQYKSPACVMGGALDITDKPNVLPGFSRSNNWIPRP